MNKRMIKTASTSLLSKVRAMVARAVMVCLTVMMATLAGCGTGDDPAGDSIGGSWAGVYNGVTFALEIDESARTFTLSANGESDHGTYDPKAGLLASDDGESFYAVAYNKAKDTITLTVEEEGVRVVFERVGGGGEDDPKGNAKLNSYEQKLVGGWSNADLGGYAWYTISVTPTVVIQELRGGSFICVITIYRPDKTGLEAYVASGGYGYKTWNWSADNLKIYRSNIISSYWRNSTQVHNNTKLDDTWLFYKIRTSEGELQYLDVNPDNYVEGSVKSIEDYIANGAVTWLSKIDKE